MAENYKRKLTNYFKKNLVKGYTADSLKYALMGQGYSRTAVDTAYAEATQELAAKAPILQEKPKISYEIIDEYNKPIMIKKPWWMRIFGG